MREHTAEEEAQGEQGEIRGRRFPKMAITDTLSDIWHGLEDKAWSVADFLEDRGIPVSGFCESKGISPLLLFLGILIAIVVILSIFSGAGGPAGNAILVVSVVDEDGNPVANQYVSVEYNGLSTKSMTGLKNGTVTFKDLPYTHVTIELISERYTAKSTSLDLTKRINRVTLKATSLTGTLRVLVSDGEGGHPTQGSIEIQNAVTKEVVETRPLDGSSEYTFTLPVWTYDVVVKSRSGGVIDRDVRKLEAEETKEVSFEVSPEAANSASVQVVVRDESEKPIPGAYVTLWNARVDGAPIANLVTDANGEVVFSNIAMQTAVYPSVYVANDKKYGRVEKDAGKRDYTTVVQHAQETIEVKLPLNGRVDVVVADEKSKAFISGASVYIKSKSGEVVSTTKKTDSEGLVEFTGFEENLEVYPVVEAVGYKKYENPVKARPVSYRGTLHFTAYLERDESVALSVINIVVRDAVFKGLIDGVDAILSDSDGNLVKALKKSNNITFEVESHKLYNVALHKKGYLRTLLPGIGPGTQTADLRASNSVNSGKVVVCTYIKLPTETESEGTATVDLFRADGILLASEETVGGNDGDNCVSFEDIPEGWSVYAVATTDGYSPEESEVYQVVSKQKGTVSINITFSALPQNAPTSGSVKVCVKDDKGAPLPGAEVLLYDFDMDAPSWDGDYRLETASDGCAIFEAIPSEKTDSTGILGPVSVYAIVSSPGYATFNGKNEGKVVQVQPEKMTSMEVRLSPGQKICITVKKGEAPVANADVSLCANPQCRQVVETKKTESDGHVMFNSKIGTSVYVKVVVNDDRAVKETTKTFSYTEVTNGRCGVVDISQITQYATVTLDGITESKITVEPGSSGEVDFIVKVNDEPATGGSIQKGEESIILAKDGTEIRVDVTGDVEVFGIRTVNAAEGRYALDFIAPEEERTYQATLRVSVPDCSTCQGDQRYLIIVVGDGDRDNDGVPDEEDKCPGTPEGTPVDSNGCPIPNAGDSDGDGVPDEMDKCPNTPPGVQVGSDGCPLAALYDRDGDGIPDKYDAYPDDATRQYPNDKNGNGVNDAYENMRQTSIQICVVDEYGLPVYDSSIIVYHAGQMVGDTSTTGYGSYYHSSAPYYPQYGQGFYPPSYGYGQAWRATYSSGNCRVFVGYTSTKSLTLSAILSSFYINVRANGYEPFDSKSTGGARIRMSSASPGGIFTIEVVLKRGKASKKGGGSIIDPARQVELLSPSWKPQTSEARQFINLHPLVTSNDRDISLKATYSLNSAAPDELSYVVNYRIIGNPCYKIESSALERGGKPLIFKKGQKAVEDELKIYSEDLCWENNDPRLESEFTMEMTGQLVQIGEKEARSTVRFTTVRLKIKPVVGATREINGLSDLPELSNIMSLSEGVVTIGRLPYCIPKTGNTGKSRLVSLHGIRDRTAMDQKIVIDFKGTSTQLSSDVSSMVKKIINYIRTKSGRSTIDCKAYITWKDQYKGYVEVGQRGFSCYSARLKIGAKEAQPWEKLFCEVIGGGQTEGNLQLGQGYAMRIESKTIS